MEKLDKIDRRIDRSTRVLGGRNEHVLVSINRKEEMMSVEKAKISSTLYYYFLLFVVSKAGSLLRRTFLDIAIVSGRKVPLQVLSQYIVKHRQQDRGISLRRIWGTSSNPKSLQAFPCQTVGLDSCHALITPSQTA